MRTGILQEIFGMALDSLKTHKLRSFLTLLGIMIGVMTVIGMVSIIQGLNRSFLAELESAGSDLIIVEKFEPGPMSRMNEEMRKRKNLTYDDAKAVEKECPLVKAVAVNLMPSFFEQIDIRYGNNKSDSSFVIGVNEKFPTVYSLFLPKEGRFLVDSEISHNARSCLLGSELADILFPNVNAIGKKIRIGPEEFTVVGVLKKRGEMFGVSRDNIVYIPITTLIKYFPYDLENLQISAVPKEHGTIPETIVQITNLLRQRRKVGFGKPNDFAVYTQETILDLYNQITGAVFLVMIAMSSIGLLVGGIGVMNIMLVSVKERTREIGIRKAIGARSGDILKQFLIEAMVLTGTGGILGVILGFSIAFLVKLVTPLPASVTAWSVVMGFIVSVSIGLFFGIFPAQKAAKLDPIVSLRYE